MPTAILSAALMQLAFMSLTCGIIVDAIGSSQRELKRWGRGPFGMGHARFAMRAGGRSRSRDDSCLLVDLQARYDLLLAEDAISATVAGVEPLGRAA